MIHPFVPHDHMFSSRKGIYHRIKRKSQQCTLLKNLSQASPSPFPLPKRARVRKYRIDYTIAFCVLNDSLALWEKVRVRGFSCSTGERLAN
jgi:hypothetical protein